MSGLPHWISSVTQPLSVFTSDARLYELDTPLGSNALLVESFVGKEELSARYEYHIACLSSDAPVELKHLLGQHVTLLTRLADDMHRARTGYVSAVAQLGADGGSARYRLTVVPWPWMATQRRVSGVARYDRYPGLSVPGVLPNETGWSCKPEHYTHFFTDARSCQWHRRFRPDLSTIRRRPS